MSFSDGLGCWSIRCHGRMKFLKLSSSLAGKNLKIFVCFPKFSCYIHVHFSHLKSGWLTMPCLDHSERFICRYSFLFVVAIVAINAPRTREDIAKQTEIKGRCYKKEISLHYHLLALWYLRFLYRKIITIIAKKIIIPFLIDTVFSIIEVIFHL